MPLLFELQRPIDDLEEMLQVEFSGQTLPVDQIYSTHSVGRPYLKRHYKSVLMQLEEANQVLVTDPKNKLRRPNTLADRLIIQFL